MHYSWNVERLERFVSAQDHGVYQQALDQVRAGKKTSHWIWFIFPQILGLGHSSTARFYGIADIDEAQAFLAHPILGPRLIEISQALLALKNRSAVSIFGDIDALKVRSSMTLFALACNGQQHCFDDVLERYYQDLPDQATLTALGRTT
jgi:uncharacterized protein (DUF1810 family)